MRRKKKKANKNKVSQYTPNNKSYRQQRAKGFYKTGESEPTIDAFSEFLSSDEYSYDLPEDQYDYERPSERIIAFEKYLKPILITVISAIIIGIGSWILIHEKKIALIEQTNEKEKDDIKDNTEEIRKLQEETEEIKSQQKLDNYRLEQLEKDKD